MIAQACLQGTYLLLMYHFVGFIVPCQNKYFLFELKYRGHVQANHVLFFFYHLLLFRNSLC
jgi:hypothetical protein